MNRLKNLKCTQLICRISAAIVRISFCFYIFFDVTFSNDISVFFSDSFDQHKEGSTGAGAIPDIGDSWTREEGGLFLYTIQKQYSKSGNALCIKKPAGEKAVLRGESDPVKGRLAGGVTIVLKVDLYYTKAGQGARLTLTPFGWPGFKPSVWLNPDGFFYIWVNEGGNEWKGRWQKTEIQQIPGIWQTIEMTFKFGNEDKGRVPGVYDIILQLPSNSKKNEKGQEISLARDVPVPLWPVKSWLHVQIENYEYQSRDTETVTYWDNVIMRSKQ